MARTHEVEQSPAAKALARLAGWRAVLRERLEALSFRRLAGEEGGPRRRCVRRSVTDAERRAARASSRPPTSRGKRTPRTPRRHGGTEERL